MRECPVEGSKANGVLLRSLTEGYLAHKWGLQGKLDKDHIFKHHSPVGTIIGEDMHEVLSRIQSEGVGVENMYVKLERM